MTTQWIILHALALLHAHHDQAALTYLHRFDHGPEFRAVVRAIRHHHDQVAVHELRHQLAQLRAAMGAQPTASA